MTGMELPQSRWRYSRKYYIEIVIVIQVFYLHTGMDWKIRFVSVICCYITNHPNTQQHETPTVLLILVIPWVDWARWVISLLQGLLIEAAVFWGSTGLEHPRWFTLLSDSWYWFLATSLAKNVEQNAWMQTLHVIWATRQYGRWVSRGNNPRANVVRKKKQRHRLRMDRVSLLTYFVD